ncbi:HipA family kinase [Allochromatium vinosum]|uniref:HipA family kinase n=1 Tax=Allochromatium vinosum TaxID=1049 RepID=UPI00190701CB|nr:HipA family kinase [Allochromatium vinosum]MBK1655487.1 hypothetical protein [Allochromatium vinosum]
MAIELLTEGAYRSYLEPTAEAGIEASHLARVCFSDGEIRRVYVKFYPESNHGLVNEITGHLLAAAIGLPVPQHAAVIFVPKIALPACPAWADTVPGESIPGWCTLDMAAPSLRFLLSQTHDEPLDTTHPLVDELRKTDKLISLMAFDDWIANTDRHLGNLLRLGKHRYLLIDHGQMFGGLTWTAKTLRDTSLRYANSLRELLAPQTHTPDYRRRLARESCAYHGEALIQVSEHLLDWWVSLLDDAERQAAAEFLGNRAQDQHICARYQMQRL